MSLVADEHRVVRAVQYSGDGREGTARFEGALPVHLRLDMGRAEARASLGVPIRSAEPREVRPLGYMPAWDNWTVEPWQIHAEYSFDGNSIRLVTVTELAGHPAT